MKLKLSCQEIQTALGNIRGTADFALTLDLASIKPKDLIKLATVDAAKMSDLLKKHPKELERCVASFKDGDLKGTDEILQRIGGTEDDFIKAGGGVGALGILVIIAVLLYSKKAH